jgi:hypothetical protein
MIFEKCYIRLKQVVYTTTFLHQIVTTNIVFSYTNSNHIETILKKKYNFMKYKICIFFTIYYS